MAVFGTDCRCQACGHKVDRDVVTCPSCNATIAEVGLWTERDEWAATRLQGRTRFILANGFLVITLPMIVVQVLVGWLRNKLNWVESTAHFVASVLMGYLLAAWQWSRAEREFLNPQSESTSCDKH